MTDIYDPLPSPTSNQQLAAAQGKIGFGKVVSALVAGWLTSYFMNKLSLHGVNFELTDVVPGVKLSSEFVKSSIDGAIEAAAVMLTPAHFVAAIIDCIRWFKNARKQISDEIDKPY